MKNKIVIASANPVKIKVVTDVVKQRLPQEDFEFIPLDLEAKGKEPLGRAETLAQIRNALTLSREKVSDATYYFALEGGVEEHSEGMNEVACVIVQNLKGEEGISTAVSFPVPQKIAQEVKEGIPFAEAVESFLKVKGIKKGSGFVGLLTDNVVNKEQLYFQPTAVALSRLIKNDWFI